jgi:hypothetical protein
MPIEHGLTKYEKDRRTTRLEQWKRTCKTGIYHGEFGPEPIGVTRGRDGRAIGNPPECVPNEEQK